jgi:hypothetical protein
MKESDIVRQVIQVVNDSRLAYVWRCQSGTLLGGRVHLAPPGTPDIVGFRRRDGRFVGLEVKVPGKKPSSEQLVAGQRIRDCGGLWGCVTSAAAALALLACVACGGEVASEPIDSTCAYSMLYPGIKTSCQAPAGDAANAYGWMVTCSRPSNAVDACQAVSELNGAPPTPGTTWYCCAAGPYAVDTNP